MEWKELWKEGTDACSSQKAKATSKCQVPPGQGKTQQHLSPWHSRTSSRNSGLQESHRNHPFVLLSKKSCQNTMANRFDLKDKGSLNITQHFNLLQNAEMKLSFMSPLNCDKLPTKPTLEKLAQFLQLISSSYKVRVTSKRDSVVRTRKGESHTLDVLRQII